jgi:hypothetical protein
MALRSGADKVSLNTAVGPSARVDFGSGAGVRVFNNRGVGGGQGQTRWVVRGVRGQWSGTDRFGRDRMGEACRRPRGRRELLLTSIDREGTGKGFDLDLVRRLAKELSVPVIACGGAGSIGHMSGRSSPGPGPMVCVYRVPSALRGDCRDLSFRPRPSLFRLVSARRGRRIQGASLPSIKRGLAVKQGWTVDPRLGTECQWLIAMSHRGDRRLWAGEHIIASKALAWSVGFETIVSSDGDPIASALTL